MVSVGYRYKPVQSPTAKLRFQCEHYSRMCTDKEISTIKIENKTLLNLMADLLG